MNIVDEMKSNGVVAVIRSATVDNINEIVSALHKGGLRIIEVTAETPNIIAILEKVTKEYGEKMLIGAGTVLDPETARMMLLAGAKFIVSPTLNIETIKMTKRYGAASVPGALTPTEILTAYENGADVVKVFPGNAFGPDYVKNLQGPLPHIPLMITGGINVDNMADYLSKGSIAVGIGSNLVDAKKLKTSADYLALTEETKNYVDRYQQIKNEIGGERK